MRIAITGSEGFMGGPLVGKLIAAGHEVLGIDDLSLGQPAPKGNGRYAFVRLDIRNQVELSEALLAFRPEQIVHLAAIHHIPTCERDAPKALSVNVVGTQNLLDAASRAECHRIVFASSGAVYDWCDGLLQADRTPTRPRDIYSISKLTNEHQLDVWQSKAGGIAVIARLFNTIGPNDRNGHLIPDILNQLRGEARPSVVALGNTSTLRDYIYVDDTANALTAMATTRFAQGKHLFNVGTGEEHGVLEIVERLAGIVGVEYVIRTDPTRIRKVDRPSQKADISETVRHLNWKPEYSFEEALRLTAAPL